MGKGIKGFFLPLPHMLSGEQWLSWPRGWFQAFLLRMRGREGVEEGRGGGCNSSTDWEGRVCQQPHPHTLGGDTRCQTPPTVALVLTVLKKLLCIQTHFAVTQLWL